MNRQIIEIVSWKIIAEFIRRYPGRFNVIETHPCSGQYDCLSIYDFSQKHIMDLNRGGSLHIWSKVNGGESSKGGTIDSYPGVWEDFVLRSNPKDVLDTICRKAGLDCNVILPSSNPEILTYRFISAFMNHTVFGLDKWECRNGCLDSSGYSSGVVDDFNKFPLAKERLRVNEKHDILNYPAYRFWFIKHAGLVSMILERPETTGFDSRLISLGKFQRWPQENSRKP